MKLIYSSVFLLSFFLSSCMATRANLGVNKPNTDGDAPILD